MIDMWLKIRERKLFTALWLFITITIVFAVLAKNFMGIGTAVILWLVLSYQVLKD